MRSTSRRHALANRRSLSLMQRLSNRSYRFGCSSLCFAPFRIVKSPLSVSQRFFGERSIPCGCCRNVIKGHWAMPGGTKAARFAYETATPLRKIRSGLASDHRIQLFLRKEAAGSCMPGNRRIVALISVTFAMYSLQCWPRRNYFCGVPLWR